jgi:HEAT repeat protein
MPKLIEALSNEEEGVVTAAVQALGEIGTRKPLAPWLGFYGAQST